MMDPNLIRWRAPPSTALDVYMSPNISKKFIGCIYICHQISPKILLKIYMSPNISKYLIWCIYITKYLQYSIWNKWDWGCKRNLHYTINKRSQNVQKIKKNILCFFFHLKWSTKRSFNIMSCWQRRKTVGQSPFHQLQVDSQKILSSSSDY